MRTLALAALLAYPAMAIASTPADLLTIGGAAFPQTDILDARATSDGTGMPNIFVTMTPAAAKRLASISKANIGKPIAIAIGNTVLMNPIVRDEITGGVIEISGIASFDAAASMARRISGKDPLPESTDE
jgi:preprotein translocase subunit SecD